MNALDELLAWLFSSRPPDEVRHKARLLVLDTLGCAFAALGHSKLQRLQAALSGGSDVAALLATSACWDEACEGLARAHGRPGVPVIAACLAYALRRDLSLAHLLDAVITGYEVGGRMGEWLRIRPGMHVDASWPSLGAAAAVTKLAAGTPSMAKAAVEIAACQLPFSLYLPIEQGADGRNTYLGHAAWLGSYAAHAAIAGCDAPRGALERFAELALGSSNRLPEPRIGQYLVLEAYLKPFAAVRHVHYGALAALRLRSRVADTSAIRAISLAVYPEALAYCNNPHPRTPLQAQFSLSFGVAAALRFGKLDPEVYERPAFDDRELRRLEALVACKTTPMETREAKLELQLENERLEEHVASIPMSEEDCRVKFIGNAAGRLGRERADIMADAFLCGPDTQSLKSILREELPA